MGLLRDPAWRVVLIYIGPLAFVDAGQKVFVARSGISIGGVPAWAGSRRKVAGAVMGIGNCPAETVPKV